MTIKNVCKKKFLRRPTNFWGSGTWKQKNLLVWPKPERRDRKQRKAKPDDIQLDGTMTGERGVRENYKIIKSKILPM